MNARRLEQKVRALFAGEVVAEVLQALEGYDGPERVRVQLGVLRCAGGDLERVRQFVASARLDYRDVLAFAEYPRQMALSASEFAALPPRARRALLGADRDAYEAWLAGEPPDDEPA